MMDQMVEAHEEVSWCLMIIPWLLKNMLFNPYLAMHIIAPIIQGDQSLDCRSQTGVLIACFCFLPSFLFHVQILFYELACFSMFLYQDVLRLMEAQSKLVAANKQLKSVSWMAKISAHWSKKHCCISRFFKHWWQIHSTFRLYFEFCKPCAYCIEWFHFFWHIRIWMQPINMQWLYKQPLESNRSQFHSKQDKKMLVFLQLRKSRHFRRRLMLLRRG